MNAKPILFSAPMIRALLDGAKTQTRRMLRPQPEPHEWQGMRGYSLEWRNPHDFMWLLVHRIPQNPVPIGQRFRCPYGSPGDLLWVRETWQEFFADEVPVWRRDAPAGRMGIPAQPDRKSVVAYRADGEISPHPEYGHAVWRPSIHMPRWASRLTLRITDVRVQRLQEITNSDACAEGAPEFDGDEPGDYLGGFRELWESIHGNESWVANPWVWALTFDVLRCNIDEVAT